MRPRRTRRPGGRRAASQRRGRPGTHHVGDSAPPTLVAPALGLTGVTWHLDQSGGGSVSHAVVGQAALAVATGMAETVVTTAERARSLRRPPVLISAAAWGGGTSHLSGGAGDPTVTAAAEPAPRLYAQAGLGPDDIDTHGGFLPEGCVHGIDHIAEAISQLRGEAGERQVPMTGHRPPDSRSALTAHLPRPDRDSAPWWELLAGRRFAVQECDFCGMLRFPPRAFCAACRAEGAHWREVPPEGTVESWIVSRQPFVPGRRDRPIPSGNGRLAAVPGGLIYGNWRAERQPVPREPVAGVFAEVTPEVTLLDWAPAGDADGSGAGIPGRT